MSFSAACYGTPAAADIDALRDFRDRYLAATLPGRAFIAAYYRASPRLAAQLRERPGARAAVRVGLKPLVIATAHPLASSGVLLLFVLTAWRIRRPATHRA